MPDIISGRCACSSVTLRLLGPPIVTHCCHCTECQRTTGSAFSINAMIEPDRLVVDGTTRAVATPSSHPAGQVYHRCPTCWTLAYALHPLFGERMRFVAVGRLDAPNAIRPDIHLFTRHRHPWVVVPDDVPAFEDGFDPQAVYSAGMLARIAAVMAD